MTDIDVSYCAGLIDGEGCIRVSRHKAYAHLTGRHHPAYNLSIHVRMVDEQAISFLQATLGGWYWREKTKHAAKGRPLYCWQATSAAGEVVLRTLLPYLRVKRESALNAIALRDLQAQGQQHRTKVTGTRTLDNGRGIKIVRNLAYSDEYIARCDALYQRSRELNKVGI